MFTEDFVAKFAWGTLEVIWIVVVAVAVIDIILAVTPGVPTLSQLVTRKARGSHGYKKSKTYEWFIWLLPVSLLFLGLVGAWLLLHFEAPCITLDILCELGKKL